MTDRATELADMKTLVLESIQAADPDKRAPLVNQWRALEASIAELAAGEEKPGDPVDEVAARRAARGGATSRPRRSAGN